MTARRVCKTHSLKIFDGFASIEDENVQCKKKTRVANYEQGEKKSVAELKSPTPADRKR